MVLQRSRADVDFLRRGEVDADRRLRLRTWNAHILAEMAGCDQVVTPTSWQRSQFPKSERGLRLSMKVSMVLVYAACVIRIVPNQHC